MKEISVYVPASSEYFSFNLDENTPLAVLADEVAAMLRQYDRCDDDKESAQPMIFYSRERQMILDGTKTLSQLEIKTGAVLAII